MTIVSVEYDESDTNYATSYRGVEVRLMSRSATFHSGDVIRDFAEAIAYARTINDYGPVMLSSSCDHFVDDFSDGYEWSADEMIVRRKSK